MDQIFRRCLQYTVPFTAMKQNQNGSTLGRGDSALCVGVCVCVLERCVCRCFHSVGGRMATLSIPAGNLLC